MRNCRPSFHYGMYGGLAYSAFSTLVRGKEPWTLSHGGEYDLLVNTNIHKNLKFYLLENWMVPMWSVKTVPFKRHTHIVVNY